MCENHVQKNNKYVKDISTYDLWMERGTALRDLDASQIREVISKDDAEESGGEEFLGDELILAAVLGIAFAKVGEPLTEQMFKIIDAEGMRSFNKAVDAVDNDFARVFEYENTPARVEEAINHVIHNGSALAGSRTLIDDAFRTKEILADMVQATRYFTNNHFNNVILPQLQGIIANVLDAGGDLDKDAYAKIRQAMEARLKNTPYWRVVGNAASSRGYHYGAVKAGMISGQRAYQLVAVLDRKTSKQCRTLNGKQFWLADAEIQVSRAAIAEGDDIKTIAPWLSFDEMEDMTVEDLKAAGFIIPPFHGNCRTTIRFI